MLLAIDTSTRYAGVLLWDKDHQVISQSWYSNSSHTVALMPAIQYTLDRARISTSDLKGIAIALGPGGFSALRVGMSVAKGLSMALEVPLFGTSTLEMEAYPYADLGLPIYPLLDLGRGEVARARFQTHKGCWIKSLPEDIVNPADLAGTVTEQAIFCGEGLLIHGDTLKNAISPKAKMIKYTGPSPRLWALAKLGAMRLQQGLPDDASLLQPLYVRRPSITAPKSARSIKL